MSDRDIRVKWTGMAGECLDEARMLFGSRMGNVLVVTKLYHSLIYALFGLFGLNDPGSSSHAELIDRYEMMYAGKKPLNQLVVSSLRSLFPLVHSCGHPRPPEPADDEVKKLFEIAAKFLDQVCSLSN